MLRSQSERRVVARIPKARLAVLLLALIAALVTLSGVPKSSGAPRLPIDLNGDVNAEQCAPCHLQLGEATYPGLIFSHGNHLMVGCRSCHYRMAHVGGTTYRPPMESCFNCHGIQHGPQGELASSACRDCHTPAFRLKPRSHTKRWAGAPHGKASAKTANTCLMCHDARADCGSCHEREGVRAAVTPRRYVPVLPATRPGAAVPVYPDRPTSISQCVNCHPDLDDFEQGAVIFAHDPHLRRNFGCTVCHAEFGHAEEKVRRPDMRSCYRCHGLTHAANGLVAAEDCGKCHPKGFALKPSDHTRAFTAGTHGKRAGSDGSYCAMCHKAAFCVECHQGRRARADGSPGKPVIPRDHRRHDWQGKHGKLFLAQEGACGSCHDEPTCMTCHITPMPHPVNWLSRHNVKDKASKDCNVCHKDRSSCQNCHHGSVRRAELVAASCVPCHDEMRQKPATAIQNKGFAEHAVHFGVAAKKKKGKPYKCYECHVGFGSGGGDDALSDAGHDLRLCYGCHGQLDLDSRLIAPWRGKDLCVRCHVNLQI